MLFVLLCAIISNSECLLWTNTHFALLFWYMIPTGLPSLFGSILATFLVRLHITFDESLFAMSNTMRTTIWLSFILFLLQATASLVFLWIGWLAENGRLDAEAAERKEKERYFWTFALSSFCTYLICSAVAVSIFTTNLFKWARSRKDTVQHNYIGKDTIGSLDGVMDDKRKSFALNITQQRIISMATRYVFLFLVTAVCSVLCYFTCYLGIYTFNPSILWSMDCVTNILCLYLQYPWTTHLYDKSCRKVDGCCRRLITRNVKANVSRVDNSMSAASPYLLMSSV